MHAVPPQHTSGSLNPSTAVVPYRDLLAATLATHTEVRSDAADHSIGANAIAGLYPLWVCPWV